MTSVGRNGLLARSVMNRVSDIVERRENTSAGSEDLFVKCVDSNKHPRPLSVSYENHNDQVASAICATAAR